jgi:hypothetical protein
VNQSFYFFSINSAFSALLSYKINGAMKRKGFRQKTSFPVRFPIEALAARGG